MRSWPCRLLEAAPFGSAQIGDMWYARHISDVLTDQLSLLSHYYHTHNRWRPPIIVVLPDGGEWCPDARPPIGAGLHTDGWEVTGKPPRLTVTPEIRMLLWHGRLTNGVLHSL